MLFEGVDHLDGPQGEPDGLLRLEGDNAAGLDPRERRSFQSVGRNDTVFQDVGIDADQVIPVDLGEGSVRTQIPAPELSDLRDFLTEPSAPKGAFRLSLLGQDPHHAGPGLPDFPLTSVAQLGLIE